MMKKIYTILISVFIILVVFASGSFSSELPASGNYEYSYDGRLFASLIIDGGISRNIHKFYNESTMKHGLSIGLRLGLMYFITGSLGVSVDLGTQSYNYTEEAVGSSNFSKLGLKYLTIGVAPVFQFQRFYFSPGIYFGIMTSSDYEGNLSLSSEVKFYTKPDIGLKLSLGYLIELSEKFQLLVGVEIKTQINNFNIYSNIAGKIFSATISFGVLLDLQIPQKTRREIEDENLYRYNR